MITVGDQIFALNQEIKHLKKQCQRYETVLRDIASDSNETTNTQKYASLAREALKQPLPVQADSRS